MFLHSIKRGVIFWTPSNFFLSRRICSEILRGECIYCSSKSVNGCFFSNCKDECLFHLCNWVRFFLLHCKRSAQLAFISWKEHLHGIYVTTLCCWWSGAKCSRNPVRWHWEREKKFLRRIESVIFGLNVYRLIDWAIAPEVMTFLLGPR